MLLSLLFSSPLLFLIVAASLVLSLTIHEFAHAWTADRLGDPTPRVQGRVTLNPLAHLDPVGTLALLLVGFGWGKPVMFDPYNLKSVRQDTLLISLAGPASNLVLATLLAILSPWIPIPAFALNVLITLNIFLAIFNLVPIHPLDGGKILSSLLPPELAMEYDDILNQYGFFVLLLLVLPLAGGKSPISYIVGPVADIVQTAIFGLAQFIHQLF